MASMSILGSTYISEAMDRGQGTTTSGSHVPRSILVQTKGGEMLVQGAQHGKVRDRVVTSDGKVRDRVVTSDGKVRDGVVTGDGKVRDRVVTGDLMDVTPPDSTEVVGARQPRDSIDGLTDNLAFDLACYVRPVQSALRLSSSLHSTALCTVHCSLFRALCTALCTVHFTVYRTVHCAIVYF